MDVTLPLTLDGDVTCDVCGRDPRVVSGHNTAKRCCCTHCTHPLGEHTDRLDCRTCQQACSIDATRTYR